MMVYFSKELGDPDTFDSDQYTKLKEWKKKNESRWLYETYNDDADFKGKFYRQLEIKVNAHEIFQFQREGINSGLEMEELGNNIPQLSDEAKVLLKEASQGSQGLVLHQPSVTEITIWTNGKNVIPNQNPRIIAKWKAALKELKEAELLENEDHQDELFRITHRGYEIADMIEGAT